MTFKDGVHISPIDLDRHMEICVGFLQDSFLCSFGTPDIWYRTFGSDGSAYRAWLREFPGSMFHAWHDDQIIGELMVDFRSAYLQHLYVIPTLRKMGIGTLLHAYFVNLLNENGRPRATLRVSRTNLQAVRFYERCKWRRLMADSDDPKLDLYEFTLVP
jgi:ribosomal protein S18 acetylase RimI-like enzyme